MSPRSRCFSLLLLLFSFFFSLKILFFADSAAAIMFDLPPQARECFFVKCSDQESEITG